MRKLWTHIGGALGMGMAWFIASTIVALVIEGFIDPNGEIVDVWIAVLGYPAFFSGAAFFTLLRIFERKKRFVDVSLPRAAALGAVCGLAPAAVFGLLAIASLPSSPDEIRFAWRLTAMLTLAGPPLMAVAGLVTVAFGRTVIKNIEERDRLDADHFRASK